MAGGSSGGSNNQMTAQFSNKIYKPQGQAFQELWKQLPGLYQQSADYLGAQIPGAQNYINSIIGNTNNAWQNQLAGGAYQGMGLQDQLSGSLANTLYSPTNTQQINNMIMGGAGNNYADAMRGQYVSDANRAYDNMLANLDARAAASNMSGSSRHGVATAMGLRDINSNLQRNLAETGYNTFDKDLDRKLAIANQADQATLARQQMLSGMIGNQNAAMQSGIQNAGNMQDTAMGAFAPGMMQWQPAQAWQSTLGSPIMQASGSMNGFGSGNSSSWGKG